MCLKVTARLASPVVGDVPFLDAILEYEMAQRLGLAFKIQRHMPAPEYGAVHIPVLRQRIGGVLVPCCSSPIYAPQHEAVEHFTKRLGVEHASLLRQDRQLIVAVGNSTYKSYRLPLHLRACDQIVWFVRGHRRPVLKLLRSVHSIGKKRSYGYGRVAEWTAETMAEDWCWFAPSDQGPVLMRPLPLCPQLPPNMLGYRRDFGAVQPPYWHPDRYLERVVPV
jgi:hypothetical protein